MVRTFVLTDVEGSTPLWDRDPIAMAAATARHDEIIATVVTRHGGVLVKSKGEGDSTFAVFENAADALAAAVATQLAIGAEPWRTALPLRVRIALHTGAAELRDGDWYGTTVIRTARLRGIAAGGQVLLSQATAEAVGDNLPEGCRLDDLGRVSLRGLADPLAVFAVAHERLRAVTTTRAPSASRLPSPPRLLIGRDDERRAVAEAVRDGRLVTLLGPGGVGKTALALMSAADLEVEFADGAAFVDCQGLTNADQLPAAMAAVVGAPGELWLLDYLATKNILVVLDNLEHLSGVAERIQDIVDRTPTSVRILTTSRLRLALPEERALPVTPLDPDREGTDLLLTLVRKNRPGFVATELTFATAQRIVRAVDGLPLAIELAAGAARALSLSDVERRLAHDASLSATVDWSWKLLDTVPQQLLARMALFPGGAPLDALVAVAGPIADEDAVVEAAAVLCDHSLAYVDDVDDTTRYRLLDTIRRFALDKLAAEGNERERQAHLAYVGWAQGVATRADGESEDVWAARNARETANVRAAVQWAVGPEGDASEGGKLVDILTSWWFAAGADWDAIRWCEQAADHPDAPFGARGRLRYRAAHFRMQHNDRSGAIELLRKVIDEPISDDDYDTLRGWAWYGIGQCCDAAEAVAAYDHALRVARSVGDDELEPMVLNNLGQEAHFAGDYASARRYLEEGLAAADRAGHGQGAPVILGNLGGMALAAGDFEEAAEFFGAAIARAEDDRMWKVRQLDNRAELRRIQGDLEGARVDAATAVELAVTSVRFLLPEALGALSAVHFDAGDRDVARRIIDRALTEGVDDFNMVGPTTELGRQLVRSGANEEALQQFGLALSRMTHRWHAPQRVLVHCAMATTHARLGNQAGAREHMLGVAREAGTTHDPLVVVAAIEAAAEVSAGIGRLDAAAQLLGLREALELPNLVALEQRDTRALERRVRAELGPRFDALFEQGRGLDSGRVLAELGR